MRVKKAESTSQKLVEERGWKGATKSGKTRQKRAVQKGKKWGKVDIELRKGNVANKRPKRMKIKHREANWGKG